MLTSNHRVASGSTRHFARRSLRSLVSFVTYVHRQTYRAGDGDVPSSPETADSRRPSLTKVTAIVALLVSWPAATCVGQVPTSARQTKSQRFSIEVPQRIGVVVPAPVTADAEFGKPVTLPSQPWSITSNHTAGVVVAFTVGQPFVNSAAPDWTADASLTASVGSTEGPAAWEIAKPFAKTSGSSDPESASVQVVSNERGTAEISVDVGFVPDPELMLPAGQYRTFMVCTVTAP